MKKLILTFGIAVLALGLSFGQVSQTESQIGTNSILEFRSDNAGTNRTVVRVIPKGNVSAIPASLEFFGTDFNADATNFERLVLFAKGSGNSSYVLRTDANGTGTVQPLQLTTEGNTGIFIASDGNVGINTTSPASALSVDGTIFSTEVKVKSDVTVPDYVFEDNYDLMSLEEVEAYVKENKHLPEIPSASEIEAEGGMLMSEMTLGLLKKVEELTLHMIEMKKENEELQKRIEQLEK